MYEDIADMSHLPSMQWYARLSGDRDRAQFTESLSVSTSTELKDDRMPPPET